MKKGIFYYEIQILMFVFMWKHDLSFKAGATAKGLVLGRLHIWIDPLWTRHGFPQKVRSYIRKHFFKGL